LFLEKNDFFVGYIRRFARDFDSVKIVERFTREKVRNRTQFFVTVGLAAFQFYIRKKCDFE